MKTQRNFITNSKSFLLFCIISLCLVGCLRLRSTADATRDAAALYPEKVNAVCGDWGDGYLCFMSNTDKVYCPDSPGMACFKVIL